MSRHAWYPRINESNENCFSFYITNRSSRPYVFCKKGVLEISQKIHRKTAVPESLFKSSCRPKTCNFIKKEALAQWIVWKFSGHLFSQNTRWLLLNQRHFLVDVFQQQFRDLNERHFCYVWLSYAEILFLEFRTSCSSIINLYC